MKKLSDDLVTDKYTEVWHETDFEYNAPHLFEVLSQEDLDDDGNKVTLASIHFQEGPIQEAGINGVMNEDLIAMVVTRLEHFQQSNFRCHENAMAITHLEETLYWLRKRTRARESRGVEGTHTV